MLGLELVEFEVEDEVEELEDLGLDVEAFGARVGGGGGGEQGVQVEAEGEGEVGRFEGGCHRL